MNYQDGLKTNFCKLRNAIIWPKYLSCLSSRLWQQMLRMLINVLIFCLAIVFLTLRQLPFQFSYQGHLTLTWTQTHQNIPHNRRQKIPLLWDTVSKIEESQGSRVNTVPPCGRIKPPRTHTQSFFIQKKWPALTCGNIDKGSCFFLL